MKVLSLCSGYGGLELALGILFPGRVDIIAVCDNYAPARKVLAKRFPRAAQYSDVADPIIELDNADVVTFGFPCQDLSRAGKGAGLRGSRSGLFFRCAEIGNLSGARTLVIENVPQARKHQSTIDAELLRYGFITRWGRATASAAGLPHRRDRVFIVATRYGGALPHPNDPGLESVDASYPTPTVVDMGWGRTERERVVGLERGAASQAPQRKRTRAVPLPSTRTTRAGGGLPGHGVPDGSPTGVGHRSGPQHLGPAAPTRERRSPCARGARHLPSHHGTKQRLA